MKQKRSHYTDSDSDEYVTCEEPSSDSLESISDNDMPLIEKLLMSPRKSNISYIQVTNKYKQQVPVQYGAKNNQRRY